MTERQKRNEVEVPDIFTSAEYLVFGGFREDESDDGFLATKWLEADKLDGLEELGEKLDNLETLLTDIRESVWGAPDDAPVDSA